jgi:hypothetical protein
MKSWERAVQGQDRPRLDFKSHDRIAWRGGYRGLLHERMFTNRHDIRRQSPYYNM